MLRLGSVMVVVMTASCGKPTCPADSIECVWDSFKIADFTTAPDGPWENLYEVDQDQLFARASAAGDDAGVTLTLLEVEMIHENSDDSSFLNALWTDKAGCRPSLCFSACRLSKLSCFAHSRCTPARRDGLVAHATAHWVEYGKAPTTETIFVEKVIAVSAPGCPADLSAALKDSTQTIFVSKPTWVKVIIPAKGAPPVGGGAGGSGAGGGAGGGSGGGANPCPNGFVGSTKLKVPNGTGGCTESGAADQCLTSADFAGTGIPYPGLCAPQGTTGCFSSGAVAKPCCGVLKCVVGSACGGDATFGGKCL